MHERLEKGLSSLAPGRTLYWTLGPSHELVTREGSMSHTIRIACDGPFGPVEPSEYEIDFEDFRVSVARYDGTLRDIAKSIDKASQALAQATGRAAHEIAGAMEQPDPKGSPNEGEADSLA